MRFGYIPLLLLGLALHAPIALAQSEPVPAPGSTPGEAEAQPEPSVATVPTPAQTAERAEPAQRESYERAPEPAPPAATWATPEPSSSSAGWTVIGIGGSIGAANIALGASLLFQGETNAELRLGSATLTAGITGLAVSVLIGALMM